MKLYFEDFDDNSEFNVGDRFVLTFPEGDSAEVTILDKYKSGKVRWMRVHPDYGKSIKISEPSELKRFLDYNNYTKA